MDSLTQALLMGAAGVRDKKTYVDDVFSTHLYTGNQTARNINIGIDMASEGGLTWVKGRDNLEQHYLHDSTMNAGIALNSNNNSTGYDDTSRFNTFTSTGFSVGNDDGCNKNNQTYSSWSFRKAKKFFDVVSYTGNGTAGRTISHSLGCVPGFITVKCTSDSDEWECYHRSLGAGKAIHLQDTQAAFNSSSRWNDTAPTAGVFTVGDNPGCNDNGKTYVAYLFAHNNGDGEFGEGKDQDIIKCGSYTGNASSSGPTINLGWEPQFLLIRVAGTSGNWIMFDSMRGLVIGNGDKRFDVNQNDAESVRNWVDITSTGFKITTDDGDVNSNSESHIYMAIRRPDGLTAKPADVGTDVFSTSVGLGSSEPFSFTAGFPVDFWLHRQPGQTRNWFTSARLIGDKYVYTDTTDDEDTTNGGITYDSNTQVGFGYDSGWQSWCWKRCAGFDVVTYTGTGSATTQNHSLGKVPEMMWIKNRGTAGKNWQVYHKGMNGGTNPEQYRMRLNSNVAEGDYGDSSWNDTAPTSSVFTVGTHSETNGSGEKYIAMLFASVEGISKVGYYTGTGFSGNTQTLGFQPRFIIQKRADGSSSWNVLDSVRGITDHRLELDGDGAEDDSVTCVSVSSTGFTPHNAFLNAANDKYIYYAHS